MVGYLDIWVMLCLVSGRYARKLAKLSHLVEQCAHHVASLLPYYFGAKIPAFENLLARFFLFLSANGESLWSLRL